jgi:hypothetical protein
VVTFLFLRSTPAPTAQKIHRRQALIQTEKKSSTRFLASSISVNPCSSVVLTFLFLDRLRQNLAADRFYFSHSLDTTLMKKQNRARFISELFLSVTPAIAHR